MKDVLDGLSDIDAANVVRCARVLLRRPLLRADGPDGDLLPLVYRHRATLQDLFAGLLAYRLVVERRFARLYKPGPGVDPTRGEPTLSPRGYTYFALTIAALTGVGRQVLLSRLVTDVRAAAVEAGVAITDDLPDRRALTAALRHLLALGVITETEGTVAPWGSDGPAEALITIDTDLLGQLLSGPLLEATGPDHLIELAARPGPRGAEHAVRRKLVENPVVLQADLPPDQVEWLRRNQRRESGLLERSFGLVTETRLEGVAVTDPEDYLTDVLFPGSGTVARIALLALPELIADPDPELFADDEEPPEPRPDGRHPVTYGQVRVICGQLVEDYPAAWSRQATEDLDRLTADVLDLLVRMGLAVDDPEQGWLIAPTAHRWAPQPDDTPARNAPPPPPAEPEEPGWSLFDEDGAQ
ncbi:TIGR02678 family protein [Kutzneria sp. NPDC052558]|uniref:TIGR02678 family protein n=1 Tax=Kutzneria sp. NPDC052558 TaxID=3364121 RepID=UPI0037CB5CC8